MKYVGIVLVKKTSKRLPNKNYLKIKNKPLYQYSEEALKRAGLETHVFEEGKNRPINASLPDEPIFNALQWAYKSLDKKFDAVVNVMANCPGHDRWSVLMAIKRFEKLGCKELRSFNSDGSESGLMILDSNYLLEKKEISTYQGCIYQESIEIHTQNDYQKLL